MKLIPFEVKEVKESSNEIPYGVQMMKAPEIWAKGEKGKGGEKKTKKRNGKDR